VNEDFRVFQFFFSTSLTLQPIISPNNDPKKSETCLPIIKRSVDMDQKFGVFIVGQVIWDKQRHRVAINHSGPSMTISRD
jgi:hypothetical protein